MIIVHKHTHDKVLKYIYLLQYSCGVLWWLRWSLMELASGFPAIAISEGGTTATLGDPLQGSCLGDKQNEDAVGEVLNILGKTQHWLIIIQYCIHKSVNIQNMLSPSIVMTPNKKAVRQKRFVWRLRCEFCSLLNGTCQFHSLSNKI